MKRLACFLLVFSTAFAQNASTAPDLSPQETAFASTLTPNEARDFRDGYAGYAEDASDPHTISLVQGILNMIGYAVAQSGTLDKPTAKELRRYQKDHKIPVTGKVDTITYFMLSEQLNHPPTFGQLRDSRSLPKWASTVCLVEKNSNGDIPEGSSNNTASSFFVLGASGSGIQVQDYIAGHPTSPTKWNRLASSFDSVNFSLIGDPTKPDAKFALLDIDWAHGGAFQISIRNTITNEPRFASSGHCHHIT